MKLQTVENKIKDEIDQSSQLETGTSVRPEPLPHSKKVAHTEKSKQDQVMAHSLKSKKDFLQNWIRRRKLSGGLFMLDVSIRLSSINMLLVTILFGILMVYVGIKSYLSY